MKVRAIRNKILVSNIEKGERKTKAGIVLTDDDKKSAGVRPRWARIYSIGPDVKTDEFKVGDWILLEHGKWTRAMEIEDENGERVQLWGTVWPEAIILTSTEQPVEFSDRF